jgi:hypothetical protein
MSETCLPNPEPLPFLGNNKRVNQIRERKEAMGEQNTKSTLIDPRRLPIQIRIEF